MAEAPQPVLQLSTRRSGSNTRSWVTRAMIVQIAILAAILSVHYRYVLYRLITIWHTDGDWSHGFLIPLFSLYYLYMQRNRAPVDVPRRGVVAQFMGAGLLTLGFAVYVSCTLLRIDYPKSISLIISILGMILLVCGWPWTRWSWFAVIFLLFALPVPGRLYVQLTMPLRFIAAKVSAAALSTCVPGMDA